MSEVGDWIDRLEATATPPTPRAPARFRPPVGAQRAAQRDRIEWPPGSGRVAAYSQEERNLVRAILNSGAPSAANEVEVLHELKVEFDGLVREPSEDWT